MNKKQKDEIKVINIKTLKQQIKSIETEIYLININERYMKDLYIKFNLNNYLDFNYRYVENLNKKITAFKKQIIKIK